jgi:membrane-associated protease RseP (regulator of RpoE activity)
MSESTQISQPILTDIPRFDYTAARTAQIDKPERIPTVNKVLFGLTALTTTMAGAYMAGGELSLAHPVRAIAELFTGLKFSIPLMAILLFHEMGHYLTARRNDVRATLPYFIPAPFPSLFIIGTFGAFIRMKAPPRSRRVMFDVGAAGPWAGMLLAIPAVMIGLKLSQVGPLDQSGGGLELGNSLLFYGLSRWILGVDPNSVMINLHPIAFAGWIGMFVTALNLLPVGQLDGGHVTYALFGRKRHRQISTLFVISCFLMVAVSYVFKWSFWSGWVFWGVLLIFLGLGHPNTVDTDTELDPRRRFAAWATIVLFILTFMPVPLSFTPPSFGTPTQEQRQDGSGPTYDIHFQPEGRLPCQVLIKL